MDVVTFKVSAEVARWLAARAKLGKRSKSDVVREAVERMREGDRRGSALDLAGDAVGRVTSGRADLASNKAYLRGFGR
jgi:predicted DNA-binding protein